MKLRLREKEWNIIKNILDRSFSSSKRNIEWGIIGIIKKFGNFSYVITDIVPPDNRSDINHTKGGICFSANYIRRVQLYARKRHCTGLIFFHTHPFSDNKVSYSSYDDSEEPLLMGNLKDVWLGSEHVSVVVGKRSIAARVYTNENQVLPISMISIIGKTIKLLSEEDSVFQPVKPEHLFDRGDIITNKGALAILEKISIAVVGAGGTGSLIVELLRRTGCQNIILIDDDHMEETNLNRLLHATVLDAREKRKKVYVAAQANHLSGLNCNLKVIDNSVNDDSVQEKLKDVDLLVGCVDKDTPRYILNKIAIEACIPYIDLGTEIGIGNNKVQSLDARVTYVYPGGPCLRCRGLINAERMRLEGLHPEERRRHISMGYCEDIDIKQPAVMELNMRVASLASLLIRHLVQPFFDTTLEMDLRESILTFSHRQLKSKSDRIKPCEECGYSQ